MKPNRSGYVLMIAFVAAAGTGARAMESVSPDDVSILGCRAEQSSGPSTQSGTDSVETGNGVRIVFQNRGIAELSRVTFAVADGTQRVVRDDVGRFSPGARIDHYFAASDVSENDPLACSVVAVQQKT